jgi:hypothetical protein
MSNPVSLPIVPPQPNQEAYGFAELALFQTYTRETYLAAFGIQAPAWDPSRPSKFWFDSTADASAIGNVAAYKIFGVNSTGTWALQPLVLPAAEAAAVNLPGAVTYTPYVIAPTGATRGGSPQNAKYLSLDSDARTLMATFGATGLVDEGATNYYPISYPSDEPRRSWAILLNGHQQNVGELLAARNAQGVGSPGHWDTSQGFAIWVADPPAPTGQDDLRPPRPLPVRDLLPNEIIQTGLMSVSVARTDLQQESAKQGGAFLPDDRKTLQGIFEMVSKLAQS